MYDEHAWGMMPRLLIAPGRFTSMLIEKLLVRLLVGSGQLLLLLLFCQLVLGVSLGPSPLAVLLLVLAVVFPIVGLGMLTAGLAGSREQTLAIGLACVFTFAYLGGLLVADLGGVPVGATAVDDRVHELGDAGNERPHAAQWRPRRAAGHGGAVVREWHGVHGARDRAVQLTIRDALSLRPEARRWVVANAGGRTWREMARGRAIDPLE